MPFEKFERLPIPSVERKETGAEKVADYLKREVFLELKENGFSVSENCQIDMDPFRERYSFYEVARDQEVAGRKKRERESQERVKKSGERLEMLATAIFHKFLGEKFFVLRTSIFDDEINKVDNFLIEKKTGNPICAFDEVAEMRGPRYKEKREKVLERNLKGGAELKYSFEVRPGKERPMIEMTKVRELPIFYLALSPEALEKAEEEFAPSSKESSEYERKLFAYFITSIREQIYGSEKEKGLKDEELPPNLRNRLALFEEALKEIEPKSLRSKIFSEPKVRSEFLF